MSKRIVEQNAATLIFELSDQNRRSSSLAPDIDINEVCNTLPGHLQRKKKLSLLQKKIMVDWKIFYLKMKLSNCFRILPRLN